MGDTGILKGGGGGGGGGGRGGKENIYYLCFMQSSHLCALATWKFVREDFCEKKDQNNQTRNLINK